MDVAGFEAHFPPMEMALVWARPAHASWLHHSRQVDDESAFRIRHFPDTFVVGLAKDHIEYRCLLR